MLCIFVGFNAKGRASVELNERLHEQKRLAMKAIEGIGDVVDVDRPSVELPEMKATPHAASQPYHYSDRQTLSLVGCEPSGAFLARS